MSTARLAGGLHLSMVPLGFFSFVYVPSVLQVRADPAGLARNLAAHESLFRAGTASHLLSQIIAIVLALTLYRLFKPVNADRARLMLVLAVIGIPVACVSEVYNLSALRAVDNVQATQLLEMSRTGVLVAQIFWGLWMLPLAALVFASGFLPRLLAIPVLIGAAGYLIDSAAHVLFPKQATISQFTFAAELMLPLWLLATGVRAGRAASKT